MLKIIFRNLYKEVLETLVVVYAQLKSKIETTMPLNQTRSNTWRKGRFRGETFFCFDLFLENKPKIFNLHVQ